MFHSLDTAAQLGAKKAILHSGMISGLGPFVMEMSRILALENMFPRYLSCFEPKHFKDIFKEIPSLKMCLDTGHANIDDPDQKRLFRFLQKFPEKISHIHMSDNFGKKDSHLGVGQGSLSRIAGSAALLS